MAIKNEEIQNSSWKKEIEDDLERINYGIKNRRGTGGGPHARMVKSRLTHHL